MKRIVNSKMYAAAMLGAAAVALMPASASAQVSRIIKFTNKCKSPVEFVIRHTETGKTWDSHGWYNLKPYQSSTFSDNDVTLTQADGYSLYFYARTTDGSDWTWDGTNRQYFGNAIYPFREMNTSEGSDGSLLATITCDGK